MRSLYETAIAMRKGVRFNFHMSTRGIDIATYNQAYRMGIYPPRYPLPVDVRDVVHTGFVMSGTGAMRGVPYVWVCSIRKLWTFWKGIGLVEEWYDSDGKFHCLRHIVNKFHSGYDDV